MKEIFYCSQCGEELTEENVYFMEEEAYCLDCFEELTDVCAECGERIYISENEGTEDTPLCSHCYYHYYTRCNHCDELIMLDNAYYEQGAYYCNECYQARKSIHDYSYKPAPMFYGEGNRFFGVELEIDDGGKDYFNARQILKLANDAKEHIYIKEDGSLSDGFEIVSHPMTLDYHKNNMDWQEMMKKALAMGYYSHQSGTTGLHIHVNKSCFGEYADEQENPISRVLYFVEMFWNEMLCFSRRTESQMKQWANRYGRKNFPKETLYHAKGSKNGRYTCVNLNNYETIEFRLFRGTLKYNTLIATLQMVNEICDVAISFSDEELDNLSWNKFVSQLDNKKVPELIQYLKERRLYCNEPVLCEEEM